MDDKGPQMNAHTRKRPQVAQVNARTARILANYEKFETDVALAEAAFARGDLDTACFHAATAATVATHKHCGVFASARLEHMLQAIGRQIPDPGAGVWTRAWPYKRVLHVGTELAAVGGLTRMISRWITADPGRTNSLALTHHRGDVPDHLVDAVAESGGEIHRLNHQMGGQFAWVRELRRLARQNDLIILHVHCEDVLPLIAFAEAEKFPPVLLLNHADHIFWLGASFSHMVINLRDAATDISVRRRGVAPERNFLLPTIVDPTVRTRSRAEAKAALGLDPDKLLLLSVARQAKYRSLNGVSFADVHADVLEKHPQAQLVVVGSGDPDDWAAAKARTGGRITGLPEQPGPQAYFEAADIYVDSHPFTSSTSMMEACGYGSPLVTLFLSPPEAAIFGINHVGLVGTAIVATSRADYDAVLGRLITDSAFRHEAGEAARVAVEAAHVPPGWTRYMEQAYAAAHALPPLDNTPLDPAIEQPNVGPPDDQHEDIFGFDYSVPAIKKVYMGQLPIRQRLAVWSQLRRAGHVSGLPEALRLLLPEWLKRRLQP